MAVSRMRPLRSLLTFFLVFAVALVGIGVPDDLLPQANANAPSSPERSVEGRAPASVKEFKGAEDAARPPRKRRDPVWPSEGRGEAAPTGTELTTVPGLPVLVARAGNDRPSPTERSTITSAPVSAVERPSKVEVETLSAKQVAAIGGVGLGVRVSRADGDPDPGRIRLGLSYDGFRDAYTGGFAGRLHMVRLPACALTNPQAAKCHAVPVSVAGTNDVAKGQVVADVEVTPQAPPEGVAVYMLAVSPLGTGTEGTFAATDLKPSGRWQAGESGGSFSWSYPLPEPPSPAGDGPGLALSYSSASVDSQAWFTNPQDGWIGKGWELPVGFVERRYRPCIEDGENTNPPSQWETLQCWESPTNTPADSELVISLGGVTTHLVKEIATGAWRTEQDLGWKIEQVTGAESGDTYWRITDRKGTVYRLGFKRDASWQTQFFGNETGEPCYNQRYNNPPVCAGMWRWNLDQESDANGNVIDYTWGRETNQFCPKATGTCGTGTGQTRLVTYDKGGYLQRVEWGHNSRISGSIPTTKMEFALTGQPASDLPSDLKCDGSSAPSVCQNRTPTFFTDRELASVTTYARTPGAQTWEDVARVDLTRKVIWDSPSYAAYGWLDSIQVTGLAGAGEISLPKIGFDAVMVNARSEFDESINNSYPHKFYKAPLLGAITNELGGRTEITYGQTTACGSPAERHPVSDCWRIVHNEIPGGSEPYRAQRFTDYHKNLVQKVVEKDLVGGSPDQVTKYQYLGQPAWVIPDGLIDPWSENSYVGPNEWRGYGKVRVTAEAEVASRSSVITKVFFRGLSARDRGGIVSHPETVVLTDFDGNTVEDLPALAGRILEERTWRATEGSQTPAPAQQERAYWNFDDASGTTAADVTGNGHTATLTSATWGNGRSDAALTLNGTSGYAATGDPVVTTTDSYTVSAWVKLDATTREDTVIGQDGTVNSAFKLAYSTGDKKWRMATYQSDTAGAATIRALSTQNATAGVWTHLAGVYDAGAKKIRLYVNGTLNGETAYTTAWNATGNVQIGRTRAGSTYKDYLKGSIDEVRLYRRALTSGEITTLYGGTTSLAAPALSASALSAQIDAQQRAMLTRKPVEVTAAASPTGRTLANPDGRTFTTELWAVPHRVHSGGTWHDIDTTLAEQDSVLRPRVATVDVQVSTGGTAPFVSLRDNRGRSYALRWPTPLPRPVVKGNVATYVDAVAPGADLMVTVLPNGFRHDVVLRQRPDKPLELRFPVSSDGLNLAQGKDGGLELHAPGDSKNVIASAPRPVVIDSSAATSSTRKTVEGGRSRIGKITTRVVSGKDGTTLVLSPDPAFLAAPDTIYPVVVDPTMTLQEDDSVWIRSDEAKGWFDLSVGNVSVPKGGGVYVRRVARSLLQFDDEGLLGGATVSSASLKLTTQSGTGCPQGGIVAQRVTTPWNSDEVSWWGRPDSTTTGQVANANPNNCSTGSGAQMTWAVKPIVQAWADGQPNHGVMLAAAQEEFSSTANGFERVFDSSTAALTITYSTPGVSGFSILPSLAPAAPNVTGSLTPELLTKVIAPVPSGAKVDFEIQHDPSVPAQGSGQIWTGTTPDTPAQGQDARITVPTGKLTDGWKVQWRAKLTALTDGSDPVWSAWQNLTVSLAAVPPTPANGTESGFTEVTSVRYEYDRRVAPATSPVPSTLTTLRRERSRERLADGTYRFSDSRVVPDVYGSPVRLHDYGQDGVASDNTCTEIAYARNTTGGHWMVDLPAYQTVHQSDDCSAGTLVKKSLTLYDGASDPASNSPVNGNPTEVRLWSDQNAFLTTKATYDSYGRRTSDTKADDKTTTTAYTPAVGWPANGVTVTNPLGHTSTTWLSHLNGQAVGVRDANNNDMNIDYDALGRTTILWTPENPRSGNVPAATAAYTTPVNATTGLASGSAGRTLSRLQRIDGATPRWLTVHAYTDGFGRSRELQVPSPSGGRAVMGTVYDARGLVAASFSSVHNAAQPGSGLLNPAVTSLPQWSKTTYDALGRATAQIEMSLASELRRTITTYFGDRHVVQPPSGGKSVYHTDIRDRNVKVEEWAGTGTHYDTTYTYDFNDALTKMVDANGNVRTFSYDLIGRRIAATDPDSGNSQEHYDAEGHLAWEIDGRNQKVSFTYDDLGRRTAQWAGEPGTGTKLAEWVYDTLAKGKFTSATRFTAGNAYTDETTGYDTLGRPTGFAISIPASEGPLAGRYVFTNAYDRAGMLSEMGMPAAGGLPAENLTLSYTDLGSVNGLTSDLGSGFTYVKSTSYSATGLMTERSYGANGQIRRSLSWDQRTGWLTGVITTDKADTATPHLAQDDQYIYDISGQITRILDRTSAIPGQAQGQAECFTYDELRRLSSAWTTTGSSCAAADNQGVDPYNQSYAYDAVGNLTALTDNGQVSTYNYPASTAPRPNTVTSITRPGRTDTYTYNGAGQLTARTIDGKQGSFEWDELGQLSKATVDGKETGMVYDADGERLIRRSPDGRTTLYLGPMELELNGTTVTGKRYYSTADGAVVAMRTATSGVIWLTSGPHSSQQLAIDDATGQISRERYLPFGQRRGADDLPFTDRGFLGKVEDDSTGLVDLSARYYDPATAKFVSSDPLLDVRSPQWANPYGYAGNDPIGRSDPSGLASAESRATSSSRECLFKWCWRRSDRQEAISCAVRNFYNPGACAAGNQLTAKIKDFIVEHEGGDEEEDTRRSAIRHFLWQVFLTVLVSERFAKDVADDHEKYASTHGKESIEDQAVNAFARKYAVTHMKEIQKIISKHGFDYALNYMYHVGIGELCDHGFFTERCPMGPRNPFPKGTTPGGGVVTKAETPYMRAVKKQARIDSDCMTGPCMQSYGGHYLSIDINGGGELDARSFFEENGW